MATVMGMNLSTRFMSNPIPLANAAQQVQSLGINSIKLFDWDKIDRAFIDYAINLPAASPMRIALGIPNHRLPELSSLDGAKKLLAEIDQACSYGQGGGGAFSLFKLFRWFCLGNEPLGSWYQNKYVNVLAPAANNLYAALQATSYCKHIGVTIPQNFEFMDKSYPPSAGVIKSQYKQIIRDTCAVMRQSGAPFMVNIYPFLTQNSDRNNIKLDYAIFTRQAPQFTDPGTGKAYFNLFDAMLDALHFALADIGCQDLEIVVGECGWPTGPTTDKYPNASAATAAVFLKNLIDHCKSGKGTPQRPGKAIQCFAFEMYDEQNKDTAPGLFERQWGICDGQGKLKFPGLQW